MKLKSSTCFTKLLPNKLCHLIASLQKNYLQIKAFLASSDKIDKNFKTLQMKATANQEW